MTFAFGEAVVGRGSVRKVSFVDEESSCGESVVVGAFIEGPIATDTREAAWRLIRTMW